MKSWLDVLGRNAFWISWVTVVVSLLVVNSAFGFNVPPYLLFVLVGLIAAGMAAAILAFQGLHFACMGRERRRRRLKSLLTFSGRLGGWYVYRNGRRIALLTEPRPEEMFWDSYEITPLVEDADERSLILSSGAYWLEVAPRFRSRVLDADAEFAFVAGGLPAPGRLAVRGLYLDIAAPNLWESAWLWYWRRRYKVDQRPWDDPSDEFWKLY